MMFSSYDYYLDELKDSWRKLMRVPTYIYPDPYMYPNYNKVFPGGLYYIGKDGRGKKLNEEIYRIQAVVLGLIVDKSSIKKDPSFNSIIFTIKYKDEDGNYKQMIHNVPTIPDVPISSESLLSATLTYENNILTLDIPIETKKDEVFLNRLEDRREAPRSTR